MSKIEVDAITQQSGSTLTVGGGASKTVVADATTVTLGRCGGTVALASGATQSGFGRTGTVDWQTGSIKTATFTAANGEGYFANTAGGAFTMNLPAGSAGAIVSVQDYNNTFDSNGLTVDPNGSEKINGGTAGDSVVLSTEGQGVTFVYIDSTVGWRSVQDNQFATQGESVICASVSGSCNTIATAPCGNFNLAIFKGPGNFTVNSVASTPANNDLDYLIVAGGAGSGGDNAGGGGAGGVRFASNTFTMPCSAPAFPRRGASSVTVTAQAYPIVIGGGGTGGPGPGSAKGTDGSVSSAFGLSSAGGGSGGSDGGPVNPGNPGGSGGGNGQGGTSVGSGNTPPVTPSQGSNGGSSPSNPGGGGGGGGFMTVGSPSGGSVPGGDAGAGGGFPDELAGANGVTSGSFKFFGGGGGGGVGQPNSGCGGAAGLGGGGAGGPGGSGVGGNGTVNTGGGAGGGGQGGNGGAGGSGIVIIRYKK